MIIGRVSLLIGKALAIKPDGSSRELTLGDNIESDELISASAGGKVVIALTSGEFISVGEKETWIQTDSSSSLPEGESKAGDDQAATDNEKSITVDQPSDINSSSVQSIQAALLAGVDVTRTAQVTKVGGGSDGENSNEGSSFVMIERGGEISIDTGLDFNTIAQNGPDIVFSSRETQRIQSPLVTLFSAFDNVGEQDSINPRLIISNSSTDDAQPTFAGAGAASGATINIYDAGVLIANTNVNPDGTWSIEIPTPLNDSEHSITVTQQIVGLVESDPSVPLVFTVDTQAPADLGQITVTDDVGLEQGQVADGATTDDATPTISGIDAAPGDIIEIIDSGVVIGSVTVEVDGSWNFTPIDPLDEGAHSFTARPIDAAGNVGNETLPVTVIIDLSALTVNINITAISDDSGASNSDFITSDSSLTVFGTLSEAFINGESVQVSNDGGTQWVDAIVSGTTWSLVDVDIHSTDFRYMARILGATGRIGNSDNRDVTIEPDKPTISAVIDNLDNADEDVPNNSATNDATPTISGSAGGAATVTLYRLVDTVLVELATDISVSIDGAWNYTPELPLLLGDYELLVISTDAAGRVSEQSETRSFSLVIESSDQPSIINVIDDVDQQAANVENNTGITNDAQPEIVGTAKAGDTVTVYDKFNEERVVLGSATANSDGVWRLQLADDSDPVTVDNLVDGTHSLTAVSNVGQTTQSPESGAYRFEVDTLAPLAIDDVLLTDDQGSTTGAIDVDNTPTDDNKPEVSGTAEPGYTVNVYVDGNSEPIEVIVDPEGKWSTTLPELEDGTHKVVTEPVDDAGNVGEQSDPVEFVIDTRVLSVSIQGATDDEDLYVGELNNGDFSNDIAPVLVGTATPDSVVTVISSGVSPQIVYGSVTADAAGNWTLPVLPPHTLSDGEHVFVARVDNGTANSESSIFTLSIDSSAPAAPAMTVFDDQGDKTGVIGDGTITDDNQPQVTGTGAEVGAIIEVFLDGAAEPVASAVVDSSGRQQWQLVGHFTALE